VNAEYGVFLGLDVGKSDHHAVGVAPDGKRPHDAPLPNTEARLPALFDKLARHGRILRRVDAGDEAFAELEVLSGYDDDLAAESTRISNRIRGLLTQIHPALEHIQGPKIGHPAVRDLLSKCDGPTGLPKSGRRKLLTLVAARTPR
jgi:hypothetical protein